MDPAIFGVNPGEHIPGQVLHQYLTQFAERFDVAKRIRFHTVVENIQDGGDSGWILNLATKGKKTKVLAQKVICATGVTNEPFMPKLRGAEDFGAPLFHSKQFKEYADTLDTTKRLAVLGGAKSSWDVAYAYARAGAKVDMIIRESGKGPVWMTPVYVTPFKKALEKLIFVRFLTWLSPCIWGDADGYGFIRRFLHGTFFGRSIVNAFWWILGTDAIALGKFDNHVETKKLKPWSAAFWIGAGLSILNYPTDFLELVRNGTITVHHADIDHLSKNKVHLSTDEVLNVDALVCATGWKHAPPLQFDPPGMAQELGLPYYSTSPSLLSLKADEDIFKRFPRLKNRPNLYPKNKSELGRPAEDPQIPNEPYKLYRFLVPPNPVYIERRNIAFPGTLLCLTPAGCAQIQALWITAFFSGKIPIKASEKDIQWETELWSRFGKWRTPAGSGAKYPDFAFDTLPYLDVLLKDMGLNHMRKNGLFKNLTEPYEPADYRGLVREWQELESSKAKDESKKTS